jgi:acetyl esterase/lipase
MQAAPKDWPMLTALTNFLLRLTIRRWFANDADLRDTRRKLARFVSMTDRLSSARQTTQAGPGLFFVAPRRKLPGDAPLVVYMHGGGYIVGGLPSHAAFGA